MVAHSFPRWEGDLAGAFVWRLAQALTERGHEVTALAPADRGEVGATALGDVRVLRLRYSDPERETLAYHGAMHHSTMRSPAAALAFACLVRAFLVKVEEVCAGDRADVVHAHWWVPGGVAAGLARRNARPLVLTLHGTDVALARKVPFARVAFGALVRHAASTTAVSRALAEAAASAAGCPIEAIPVCPMPLHLKSSPPRGAERHGVVFVGRLTAQKRVHVLLDALGILSARGQRLPLTVVGDGPERVTLETRAMRPDLQGRVRFVGQVPPERVGDFLGGARLLVLPSVDEGLGLAVAEALVASVPVVASRSGGIPDLLTDPDAGVLVPPDDATALADAIAHVIGDPRYLAGARRAGRALAERLSPAAVAEWFEGVYASALEGRGR